jgi:hypothetical protein
MIRGWRRAVEGNGQVRGLLVVDASIVLVVPRQHHYPNADDRGEGCAEDAGGWAMGARARTLLACERLVPVRPHLVICCAAHSRPRSPSVRECRGSAEGL